MIRLVVGSFCVAFSLLADAAAQVVLPEAGSAERLTAVGILGVAIILILVRILPTHAKTMAEQAATFAAAITEVQRVNKDIHAVYVVALKEIAVQAHEDSQQMAAVLREMTRHCSETIQRGEVK